MSVVTVIADDPDEGVPIWVPVEGVPVDGADEVEFVFVAFTAADKGIVVVAFVLVAFPPAAKTGCKGKAGTTPAAPSKIAIKTNPLI